MKKKKAELRRALDRAERGITRSVIRWKYKQEDRTPPPDDTLDMQSRMVIDQAHHIIAKRSRGFWEELKDIYTKQKTKKERDHD